MYALIQHGKIRMIADKIFEVHPDYQWLDCPDNCAIDWLVVDGKLIEPEPLPPEPIDPEIVRNRMLKAMWEFCDKGDKSHMEAIKLEISEAKL